MHSRNIKGSIRTTTTQNPNAAYSTVLDGTENGDIEPEERAEEIHWMQHRQT